MVATYYLKRLEATTNTSIFARVSYKGYQLKYYISEKINPANWNKNTHQAKGSKNGSIQNLITGSSILKAL